MSKFMFYGKIIYIGELKFMYYNKLKAYIMCKISVDKNIFDIYFYDDLVKYILKYINLDNYVLVNGYITDKLICENIEK